MSQPLYFCPLGPCTSCFRETPRFYSLKRRKIVSFCFFITQFLRGESLCLQLLWEVLFSFFFYTAITCISKTFYLLLEGVVVNNLTVLQPMGLLDMSIPYTALQEVYVVSRWDASHKFCIRLVVPNGSILLQVHVYSSNDRPRQ